MLTGSLKELGFVGHTKQNAPEAFFEAVPWKEHRLWRQTDLDWNPG